MARFGPFSIRSIPDVAFAFKQLATGLKNISSENLVGVANYKRSWKPAYMTPAGTMTIEAKDERCDYYDICSLTYITMRVSVFTAGVAEGYIIFKLPRFSRHVTNFCAMVQDEAGLVPGIAYTQTGTDNGILCRADGAAYAAGVSNLHISGLYEVL